MPLTLPKHPGRLILATLLICCAMPVLVSSCYMLNPAAKEQSPAFEVRGDAFPYSIAMGKGRGVVFRVTIVKPQNLDTTSLHFDTLHIAHRPLPLAVTFQSDTACMAEANYMKMNQEPVPGAVPIPTTEAPDPILFNAAYYPAFVSIRYKGKRYEIPIEHFENHPL